jgi:peptidylprolyl isomerase
MHNLALWLLLSSTLASTAACRGDDGDVTPSADPTAAVNARRPGVEQVSPPFDVSRPPADATKTTSGLIYKKLVTGTAGAQPGNGQTALVRYTGWRQRTGETFFTTRGRGQPIAIDVAHAAVTGWAR